MAAVALVVASASTRRSGRETKPSQQRRISNEDERGVQPRPKKRVRTQTTKSVESEVSSDSDIHSSTTITTTTTTATSTATSTSPNSPKIITANIFRRELPQYLCAEYGATYSVGLTIEEDETTSITTSTTIATNTTNTTSTTTTRQARMVHVHAHTRNPLSKLASTDTHRMLRWRHADSVLRLEMSKHLELTSWVRECEHISTQRREIIAELKERLVRGQEDFGVTGLPCQQEFETERESSETPSTGVRGLDTEEEDGRNRQESVNFLIEENRIKTAEKLEWRTEELRKQGLDELRKRVPEEMEM
jgi:hypothetical protein